MRGTGRRVGGRDEVTSAREFGGTVDVAGRGVAGRGDGDGGVESRVKELRLAEGEDGIRDHDDGRRFRVAGQVQSLLILLYGGVPL